MTDYLVTWEVAEDSDYVPLAVRVVRDGANEDLSGFSAYVAIKHVDTGTEVVAQGDNVAATIQNPTTTAELRYTLTPTNWTDAFALFANASSRFEVEWRMVSGGGATHRIVRRCQLILSRKL